MPKTNEALPDLSPRERTTTTFTLLGLSLMMVVDLRADLTSGAPLAHCAAEGFTAVIGVGAALWLSRHYFSVKRALGVASKSLRSAEHELQGSKVTADHWRAEAAKFSHGLSQAIAGQFASWGYSPAEQQIALLLLKGLSLKEIAHVRDVSERTVHQQTLSVYQKAGLGGRAELSAYFLEDLLSPSSLSPQTKEEIHRSPLPSTSRPERSGATLN